MVVYLSGKISGLPDLNSPKFQKAEDRWKGWGCEVINPLKLLPQDPIRKWEEYMRNDIKYLVEADKVAVLDDWQQSRGAVIEVRLAFDLNIPVVDAHSALPIPRSAVAIAEKQLSSLALNLPVDRVLELVSRQFNVSSFQILSRNRKRVLTEARQAAILVLKNELEMTHSDIALLFGFSGHGTSVWNYNQAKSKASVYPVFNKRIKEVSYALQS